MKVSTVSTTLLLINYCTFSATMRDYYGLISNPHFVAHTLWKYYARSLRSQIRQVELKPLMISSPKYACPAYTKVEDPKRLSARTM